MRVTVGDGELTVIWGIGRRGDCAGGCGQMGDCLFGEETHQALAVEDEICGGSFVFYVEKSASTTCLRAGRQNMR